MGIIVSIEDKDVPERKIRLCRIRHSQCLALLPNLLSRFALQRCAFMGILSRKGDTVSSAAVMCGHTLFEYAFNRRVFLATDARQFSPC